MKAKIVELEDAIKQRDNEVSSDKTMVPVILLLLLYVIFVFVLYTCTMFRVNVLHASDCRTQKAD